MKNHKSGSALIISIFIMMIIIIIAIYLFEKIAPFTRDTKGIEYGNVAYYKANTALNEALLSMSGSTPWYGTGSSSVANGSGMIYQVTGTGYANPMPGMGNSEYDQDWMILAPGKPIQIVLKTGGPMTWMSNVVSHFWFRVPDLNKDGRWSDQTLTGTGPIINWELSVSGQTLQASGSQIMANEINGAGVNTGLVGGLNMGERLGITLDDTGSTYVDFYTKNCAPNTRVPSANICTLKFSLIKPLLLNDNITVAPYLESFIYVWQSFPLQTAIIETQGYAGGFRKNITRFVQQMTTNEAVDFTVFQ